MKRIIYPTPDGGVAVIVPAPDCGLTIEQIAAKDVPVFTRQIPTGVFETDPDTGERYEVHQIVVEQAPYRIVDVSEIPVDRTFRDAWEYAE